MSRRNARGSAMDEWGEFAGWCKAAGIAIDERACEKLALYRSLLLDWGTRMNLTAIRDPREVLIKHFLDSLLVLKHVPPQAPLLDIGSGAGFPGMVIKVVRPDQPVTLVDARAKKVGFLEHLRRSLQLSDCDILHRHLGRSEPDLEGRFSTVTSRAVRSLGAFLGLASPFVRPGGRVVAMLGRHVCPHGQTVEELARPLGGEVLASDRQRLPEGGGIRHIVVIGWPRQARST